MKLYLIILNTGTEEERVCAIFLESSDARIFIRYLTEDLGLLANINEIEHTELMLSLPFPK